MQQQGGGNLVNLARDCRLSSPRLRDAFSAGLQGSGCHVTDLGIVPTPLLYYSVIKLEATGGIMITGSHNPREYNGFKIMVGHSTIHGEDIQKLREIIEASAFASGEGSETTFDIVTPYVDEITSKFKFERKVKLIYDGGNGVGGPVFARMARKLNIEAQGLFLEMDGSFPNHDPDPTQPKNLTHLIEAVRAEPMDLGIAFDGDSDRIGAVDETGAVIYGDMLLLVYGREILSRKPGATRDWRSEVFAGDVRRAHRGWRRCGDVEDRAFLDQSQDERNRCGISWRNERPHVLRRRLLRL